MTTYSNERLAEMIVDLERRLAAATRSRQLGSSSFFGGPDQSIDVLSPASGQPLAGFGTHYDGTQGAVAYTSPTPPTPTAPILQTQPGILSAGWDGYYLSDHGVPDPTVVAPLGFAYTEIHAAPEAAGELFDARTTDTLIGTINTARGGAITAGVTAGTYWVRLVVRTTAGKPSEAGPAALVTVPNLVDTTVLEGQLVDARDEIAAAEGRLDLAEADLDFAFQTLEQIPTNIDAAKQQAIQAAALDATSKADTAKQAALDAVGLKGEVIVQTSAPTGARATAQNLWIRLPDNRPHRWNPASALVNKWEAVTDQVATDAAAAAATAQQRANDAHTLATTANSTANTALTSANGKNRITRSLSAPSNTTNPGTTAGDIWWRYQDNTWRLVIGEWTWDGDSWETQKQGHQTIASVDIGALTVVGTATISNAVAEKIAAGTATIQKADIGNLTVTGTSVMADLVAQKVAAQTGRFMYLESAQINVNQLWADLAFSNEARTHLLRVLTNNDGTGYTSTLTGQGLRVTYTTLSGEVQDVIRLGTFGDDYFAVSKAGKAVASIDATGAVNARAVEAAESFRYRGTELAETITRVGAGVYNWGEVDFGPRGADENIRIGGSVFMGIVSVDYITTGNRMTRIILTMPTMVHTNNDADLSVHVKMRITAANDTTPITEANSITFRDFTLQSPGTGKWHNVPQIIINRPIGIIDAGKRVQILVMALAGPVGNPGYCQLHGKAEIVVDDAGALPPSASVVRNSGGGKQWVAAGQTAPVIAPTPSKTTRVMEWGFTDVNSYKGDNSYYAYQEHLGFQGLQPGTGNGNLKSMFLFPDFAPWIAGSTIDKIEVFMHFDHWYYGDGGIARIHTHGYLNSLPATWDGTYSHDETGWGINSGRWFQLGAGWFPGFLSGATRGISLAGDGTLRTYGYASNCRIRITYTK